MGEKIGASMTNTRRFPRVAVEGLVSRLEVNRTQLDADVIDFSAEGARVRISGTGKVEVGDEVRLAVGHDTPNVQATVRWVRPSEDGQWSEAGVEFAAFVIMTPAPDTDAAAVVQAWTEMAETWGAYESFQQILEDVDEACLDGQVEDVGAALRRVLRWANETVGPVNAWHAQRAGAPAGEFTLDVDAHPVPGASLEARRELVERAVRTGLTQWAGPVVYLYGKDLALEYLGEDPSKAEMLQKVSLALDRRVRFWSRLLLKNRALAEAARRAGTAS